MDIMDKIGVAILGSGNIGTDLMIKVLRTSKILEAIALVGIDPESEGLDRARKLGVLAIDSGLEGLIARPEFARVRIVFDATSAKSHQRHHDILISLGRRIVDLTPSAIGPYVIPVVNLNSHLKKSNVNMVTCGGQATIPIVAAVSRVAKVHYSEIVASIASKSAGPGTRANIDEFTETTARAVEAVGGAARGKAIIILNPAEPPLLMRDTVYCFCEDADPKKITASIESMVGEVQKYVPGYRLKQEVQFERISHNEQIYIPDLHASFSGMKVTTFLEVEGAAHYLPAYAGNLDIMTSAALRTAERIVDTSIGSEA
jgi:acetaldehyde dehydrogenase